MGLKDDIKKKARNADYFHNKSTAKEGGMNAKDKELLGYINRTFYLEKNAEEETKFVKQMITRGLESQERVGLHASAIIKPDSEFCIRQQVLSLKYKMLQGEQVGIGLKRIFEEGNAIHEKLQRLLIRAGYGKAVDMDLTQMNERYMLSYTPDIICEIPEFTSGKMVGEIKSVNTFAFQKMKTHESADDQLQLYMHLTGIHKGFVLCEDKNTQDLKVYYREYEAEKVKLFVDRLEEISKRYKKLNKGKIPKRKKGCNEYDCKIASTCPMREVCYNKRRELINDV